MYLFIYNEVDEEIEFQAIVSRAYYHPGDYYNPPEEDVEYYICDMKGNEITEDHPLYKYLDEFEKKADDNLSGMIEEFEEAEFDAEADRWGEY